MFIKEAFSEKLHASSTDILLWNFHIFQNSYSKKDLGADAFVLSLSFGCKENDHLRVTEAHNIISLCRRKTSFKLELQWLEIRSVSFYFINNSKKSKKQKFF